MSGRRNAFGVALFFRPPHSIDAPPARSAVRILSDHRPWLHIHLLKPPYVQPAMSRTINI